jgi:hypothetical protein
MKYTPTTQIIPQDRRGEINDKLLFLAEYGRLDQYSVTREEVFNSLPAMAVCTALNMGTTATTTNTAGQKRKRATGST